MNDIRRKARQRAEIETYFDRTAADAWARLTSTAPVSGIRATVRAGRDRMRATLLDWLPADLRGMRLLDAGCGTGALAVEAAHARRAGGGHRPVAHAGGAGPRSHAAAAQRRAHRVRSGRHARPVSGQLRPCGGRWTQLIHYTPRDVVRVLSGWSQRTHHSMLFTFAPRTRCSS
jgi:magnesium-protoporphyrin O-methyltransferase